jgi:hypothetical protein
MGVGGWWLVVSAVRKATGLAGVDERVLLVLFVVLVLFAGANLSHVALAPRLFQPGSQP